MQAVEIIRSQSFARCLGGATASGLCASHGWVHVRLEWLPPRLQVGVIHARSSATRCQVSANTLTPRA
jgi:hypothetical protein